MMKVCSLTHLGVPPFSAHAPPVAGVPCVPCVADPVLTPESSKADVKAWLIANDFEDEVKTFRRFNGQRMLELTVRHSALRSKYATVCTRTACSRVVWPGLAERRAQGVPGRSGWHAIVQDAPRIQGRAKCQCSTTATAATTTSRGHALRGPSTWWCGRWRWLRGLCGQRQREPDRGKPGRWLPGVWCCKASIPTTTAAAATIACVTTWITTAADVAGRWQRGTQLVVALAWPSRQRLWRLAEFTR